MISFLLIAIPVIWLCATLYGLFLLVLKSGQRKRGASIIVGALVGSFVAFSIASIVDDVQAARRAGFDGLSDRHAAEKAGYSDAVKWRAVRKALEQEERQKKEREKAEETARLEAERLERERLEAEKAAREEAERLEAERAEAAAKAEERRRGWHCLSLWDGAHTGVKRTVKQALRDPGSFEHVDTRITPVDDDGTHRLIMTYRARNGFGGLNVAHAHATIQNDGCDFVMISME